MEERENHTAEMKSKQQENLPKSKTGEEEKEFPYVGKRTSMLKVDKNKTRKRHITI